MVGTVSEVFRVVFSRDIPQSIDHEGRERAGGRERYAEEERKEVNSGISQWGEKDHINEVKKGEGRVMPYKDRLTHQHLTMNGISVS